MKTTIIKSLMAVLVALFSLYTNASSVEIEGVYYNLKGSVAEVTQGDVKYKGKITIPFAVGYNGVRYNVTSIGKSAFYKCDALTSITIPNSVTSIGITAFMGCDYLTSVTMGDGVTTIGDEAFSSCSRLESITIPNSVKEIGRYVFWGCTNLTSVTIGDGITTISEGAFSRCAKLTSITIPDNVTSIGNNAFSECTRLSSVNLSNSVTSIGASAFGHCTSLTSITLPNSLTVMGGSAFGSCKSLTSITIPNSVTIIGNSAFSGCTGLTSITIPNSVTEIKQGAFYGCSGLTSVTIGNGVTTIGGWAFEGCSSLKSIVVPKNVENFGEDIFSNCPYLLTIIYLSDYYSKEGSNATVYNLTDFLPINEYVYSGKAPTFILHNNPPFYFRSSFDRSLIKQDVGTYTVPVPLMFNDGRSVFSFDIEYTYTIKPAKIKARIKNTSRTYGETNPKFETTYSGFVNGEDESVITSHGEYSTTATYKSDAGEYSIKQSGATAQNYIFDYEEGVLTVEKASLKVKAKDATRTYGEDNPQFALIYSGFINDDNETSLSTAPIYNTKANKKSDIGTYLITGNGGNAKNYALEYETGNLTVTKAPLTISVESSTREYGKDNPRFSLSYSGLKNEEINPEWTTIPMFNTDATMSSEVGTYVVKVTCEPKNYEATINNGELIITKAPLTIWAQNYVVKQGDAIPTFEAIYDGFKNNETKDVLIKQPFFSCSATPASEPDIYDIIISGAEAKNYNITYKSGTLTVIDADAVVVIAKNYTRKYGEANPIFEYTSSGVELTGVPNIICEAVVTSPVGTYPIMISKGSVTNYNDSYINGTLTITKAPLTVTAQSYVVKRGDAFPVFDVEYVGFKNNEKANVMIKKPSISCTASSSNVLGTYEIVADGAETNNYDIAYVAGTLTIIAQDSYNMTYTVDGDIYMSYPIEYKSGIIAEAEPTKEGYTFSGWSEIPATMPDHDVTVTGSFTINKYKLTYMVDGMEYKTFDMEYGASITAEATPIKEGYTFSGWNDIPVTMPAKDVTITGNFIFIDVIEDVITDDDSYEIYTLDGKQVETLQKGVNIIRYSGGSTQKVFVK